MKRVITTLLVALAVLLGLGASPASAGPPETGGLVDWSFSYGACCGPVINPGTLYVIDKTDSRFPVETVASEWNIRTDAVVQYRWGGPNPDPYDCSQVHCAYIESLNDGATGWRVRVTNSQLDGAGRYMIAVVTINTYYAWGVAGTVSKSGSCQAVGKGLGLDYTRSTTDYRSCMSSAMRYTVGNSLDDGYVNQLW
jgi:hypothetical protein